MKPCMIIIALLMTAGISGADLIRETALRLYPSNRDAQLNYIKSERKSLADFENYPASASTPALLLDEIRKHCVRDHPASMSGRLMELKAQIISHHHLRKAPWGDDLPAQVKKKILAVGEMLRRGDYSAQYRYAIAEAQAYRRLKKIPFDRAAAEKKYPNHYGSQLRELLGFRAP